MIRWRKSWHARTYIYRQDYVQTYKDTYIHTADKQTGRQTHVLCVSSSLCTGTVAGWAAGRWISLKNEVCDTSANKKGFKRAPEGHFDSFKKKVFRKILCSTSCYLASPKKTPSSRPFLRDVSNGLLVFIRKSNQPSGLDWFW